MGRALGEAKREAQTVDDAANNNKQGEKEACDEGVLFIAGSAKRAKRNAKSTQRSNIGSQQRSPCKNENDFGKSKRTRQSFGKKASGQKANNQAKAHRAHLGT